MGPVVAGKSNWWGRVGTDMMGRRRWEQMGRLQMETRRRMFVTDAGEKSGKDPPKRRMRDDMEEYKARLMTGSTAWFDEGLIQVDDAKVFPRIKTTSLSTKRMVIHDEAREVDVTLVVVAFRSFADEQLQSWKQSFIEGMRGEKVKWFDVTVNESFGAQALSGFVQRMQRGRTDVSEHDYFVAFNSKAREPLEVLLPSTNRMFGYALLLDAQARVRFRASGMATEEGKQAMLSCAKQLTTANPSQA